MTVVTSRTAHRLAAALLVVAGVIQTSPLLAQSTPSRSQGQPPQQQAPPPQTPQPSTPKPSSQPPTTPATPPAGVLPANVPPPPADYVIGAEDVLQVVFWREKDLSAEVTVRPDGKISLSLLNDVQAAGLTPEQLRKSIIDAASRYVNDPSVTIVVKTINSRKVYVTGQVNKPGTFPLTTDQMTVLQMLALAGGLQEYADAEHVLVMRTERGETKSFKFNYKDVRKGKNLQQNIVLKPGDTIVVP